VIDLPRTPMKPSGRRTTGHAEIHDRAASAHSCQSAASTPAAKNPHQMMEGTGKTTRSFRAF